jgi:iron complex outermembrane receptor protein
MIARATQQLVAATVHAAAVAMLCSRAGAQEATLPEVSVTASRNTAIDARRNASAAKIVYDREDLDTLDAASIGDLLRKLPGTGVFADPDNRRGRGKGRDRHMPQILVDGQPLPGGDRSAGTALRLPVDLIERIEIIRNSTPEFPAAGPGGIINLVLRDVPPRATRGARIAVGTLDGEAGLRLDGQYGERLGDFGYLLGGSLQSQPQVGQIDTDIQRFTAGSRNDWTIEQIRENGRDNNLALTPRAHWNLGDGRQFALSSFLNLTDNSRDSLIRRNTYADPVNGSGLQASGHDREYEDGQRGSARLNGEWRSLQPGGSEWLLRLTAQGEFERKEKQVGKYDANGQNIGSSDESTRRYERELAALLKGKRLVADSHLLTAAIEWRGKNSADSQERHASGLPTGNAADSRASIEDRRQVAWIQDEWQIADDHTLTPGLRWQGQNSTVTDGSGARIEHTHAGFDPSLHYLWQLSPAWNLRSSIALTSKPPNAKDLSTVVRTSTGSNTSANPDKAGNPSLAAERSLSLDLGVEFFLPERAGTVGLSVFHRRIEQQVQKLVAFESGRWIERPYNVGDAELQGGLFDLKWRADALHLPELTLRGNLSYTQTRLRNRVDGLGAGEGPRQSANLGFDYDFASWPLTVGSNFSYTGALDRESSARVRQEQGQRRQLDVYALYRIDRQLAMRLSAQNVTQAERGNSVQEYDTNGQPSRLESDRETSFTSLFLTLEGKW